MSNRFHNKFHRYNHHSTKLPEYGDSGYDPIASKDAPFLGEFVVSSGYISAIDPDGDFSIYTDNLSADLINNRTLQTESITAETLVVTSVNLLY